MFVAHDIVFHEDSMYFSSKSELRGEYQEEIQNLHYDVRISIEVVPYKHDMSTVDISGINLDASGDKTQKLVTKMWESWMQVV